MVLIVILHGINIYKHRALTNGECLSGVVEYPLAFYYGDPSSSLQTDRVLFVLVCLLSLSVVFVKD